MYVGGWCGSDLMAQLDDTMLPIRGWETLQDRAEISSFEFIVLSHFVSAGHLFLLCIVFVGVLSPDRDVVGWSSVDSIG